MAMVGYDTHDRNTAYAQAIEDARRAWAEQHAKGKEEIARIVDKARADVAGCTTPQYRLECIRLAEGDIDEAAKIFAFVMGGEK